MKSGLCRGKALGPVNAELHKVKETAQEAGKKNSRKLCSKNCMKKETMQVQRSLVLPEDRLGVRDLHPEDSSLGISRKNPGFSVAPTVSTLDTRFCPAT